MKAQKIGDDEARTLRPAPLPDPEPELARPTPRPFVWAAREFTHGRITDEMHDLLVEGVAARAWVTRYATERDREGTDHLVQYAFESEGVLIQSRWVAGFDDYHLAVGFSDYAGWLGQAMCEGGTFTVLHPPGRPSAPSIYGNMELYIRQDLVEVADALAAARSPEEIDRLAERFLGIAYAPSGLIREGREEYLDLLERIGLARSAGRDDRDRHLEVVRETIRSGDVDGAHLEALASVCFAYRPGIWAAR